LQIAVKAVNDIAGLESLVLILLVFRAYPRIVQLSALSLFIIKRAEAVQTAIAKLRQLKAKQQIKDILIIRNRLNIVETLNLLI